MPFICMVPGLRSDRLLRFYLVQIAKLTNALIGNKSHFARYVEVKTENLTLQVRHRLSGPNLLYYDQGNVIVCAMFSPSWRL